VLQDPARFAEFKQGLLDRQQERIDALQQAVVCFQDAQDLAAIKKCREQERATLAKESRQTNGPGNGPPRE
jgi:hypothetical protein